MIGASILAADQAVGHALNERSIGMATGRWTGAHGDLFPPAIVLMPDPRVSASDHRNLPVDAASVTGARTHGGVLARKPSEEEAQDG